MLFIDLTWDTIKIKAGGIAVRPANIDSTGNLSQKANMHVKENVIGIQASTKDRIGFIIGILLVSR
jgi:hypothetical protein